MERPAHTALFQSIWNHPAEENGQNVNLGSWGGILLRSAFAFATFGCSHNSCAGELPRSASSHFFLYLYLSFALTFVFIYYVTLTWDRCRSDVGNIFSDEHWGVIQSRSAYNIGCICFTFLHSMCSNIIKKHVLNLTCDH